MTPVSTLKPSEVLAKAADLIEPEGAWTQGAYARGSRGRPVRATGGAAKCWCAASAVQHELRGQNVGAVTFAQNVMNGSILIFNDAKGRTQAEVVAALRTASELAKAEGK